MDGARFESLARSLVTVRSRRRILSLILGGVLAPLGARFGLTPAPAAACGSFQTPCATNAGCCGIFGLRCDDGACRCQPGFKHCVPGPICQDLSSNANHCGACGNTCPAAKPCCIKGVCKPKCGDVCCAECFIELLPNGVPKPDSEVCCGGANGTICGGKKPGKADDRCCYPDELCLKGKCCADNTLGARECDGRCCAQAACCNNGQKCCPKGEVCVTKTLGDPHQSCVPANRSCANAGGCYPGEVCHGGTCCSGARICQDLISGDPVCCGAKAYCAFQGQPNARCVPINTSASTYRGNRIRP